MRNGIRLAGQMMFKGAAGKALLRLALQDKSVGHVARGILKEAIGWDSLPNGWTQDSVKKFWESLTGEAKHKVTKCIKEMQGKFDDPGAFCASLADMVDPGWRSRKAVEDPKWRSIVATQDAYKELGQLKEALSRKYPQAELSFGYIGNVYRDLDDRAWYFFTQIPKERWGRDRWKFGGYTTDRLSDFLQWAKTNLERGIQKALASAEEQTAAARRASGPLSLSPENLEAYKGLEQLLGVMRRAYPQAGLVLGYMGNLYPRGDDREFYFFSAIPKGRYGADRYHFPDQLGQGGYPTEKLPEFLTWARANLGAQVKKALAEAWKSPSGRRASGPLFDVAAILVDEGLTFLGDRYGKAGDFYGIQGSSRVISIGRRELLANVFYAGIHRDDQIKKPDTRWSNHASVLLSRTNEAQVRKWAAWAKKGLSMVQVRDLARRNYDDAKQRGEQYPMGHATGATGSGVAMMAMKLASRWLDTFPRGF